MNPYKHKLLTRLRCRITDALFCMAVFCATVFCASLAGCSSGSGAPTEKPALSAEPPALETLTLEKGALPQQVKLPGQLAAFEEVSIFPKVNGYVKEVFVDVGSAVHKGQLLMTLEAPELQQASTQARERYARAKLDYTLSEENYQRMQQAARTPGAVSPMNLASLKAKADADSTLSNAENANWQEQIAILGYLRVTAPFDGVISERNVHPGALVSAEAHDGHPMLDLREIDHLRLQVDIPEGIAAGLQPRDTISFYLSAYPGKKMLGHISRKSQLVNSQFRAERMELDVDNHDGRLAPGMYADVLFDSKGNADGYTVPRTAVVTSTERKYVVAVRDGRTVRVDVATGNESTDKVEVTGDLQPRERIVRKASDDLQEGLVIK
jgi:membrane fusion protein, multidrug efflux system